ncbi:MULTISPECIES: CPBP family intramembrane glutamic endopeptidase [Cyanophyceae]|uniref:CPBP family intramembrane glutamic endopeptidase n=1 Tax=Cyanophyceae TaxID=3028117 RepID=UPI001684BD9A|nr:type II CAAX endopeptidase family protein [Trichocoleus sp. FACHB-40]MBD2006109.1 CPBP family intramembrane metalloprotease [Trichocoleus sp. FACHB-40]
MLKTNSAQNAVLALFLLVSAASIGIAGRLYIPGAVGQFLFVLTRVWILALPLIWFLWIDRGRVVLSVPSRREFLAGTILGMLMFGIILGAYWIVGQRWIDSVDVRAKAQQVGIATPTVYLIGAFYFTVINSLIEEYIWRWFVYRKCEVLLPGIGAVYLAALFFTLHHIIALAGYIGNGLVVVLGSLGVFIAGAVWSWCYLTYRSLWSCYISHLLADLAIALVGWHLLFG